MAGDVGKDVRGYTLDTTSMKAKQRDNTVPVGYDRTRKTDQEKNEHRCGLPRKFHRVEGDYRNCER